MPAGRTTERSVTVSARATLAPRLWLPRAQQSPELGSPRRHTAQEGDEGGRARSPQAPGHPLCFSASSGGQSTWPRGQGCSGPEGRSSPSQFPAAKPWAGSRLPGQSTEQPWASFCHTRSPPPVGSTAPHLRGCCFLHSTPSPRTPMAPTAPCWSLMTPQHSQGVDPISPFISSAFISVPAAAYGIY